MYKKISLGLCLFLAINIALQPLSLAVKIDPKKFQELYAENEIRFYEGDNKTTCSSVSAHGISGNSNQEKMRG